MKKIYLQILLMLLAATGRAQEGSDIKYIDPEKIDKSFIGAKIQLDFFRNSNNRPNRDTVTINIDNKPIRFIEVRNDNGYNNWFDQQWLLSLHPVDDLKIRIAYFELTGINQDSLQVKMYIQYYDPQDKLLPDRSTVTEYTFPKKDIFMVLAK